MHGKTLANWGMPAVLAAVILCVVAHADAAVERLLPRSADSAIQGFESRMMDSAIQRFDSPMKNSRVQRFDSRMISSPVSRFESRMRDFALQRFDSQMMDSPAQRVEGPAKPRRLVTFLFAQTRQHIPSSAREPKTIGSLASRPTASPIFISQRCGTFTEITVGKSEILSEKEGAPCADSEEGITDSAETNEINSHRF
jgi:hypothetical protein